MRILLVRLRLVGDVVFTTPIIRALRRHYPDAHLTYLVEAAAAPVVQASPHLDDVMIVLKRRGLARLRDDAAIAARLRAGAFDLAIDLHGGPRSAWLTWASGARRRIGYATKWRRWVYTDSVPRPADGSAIHSVVKQWALLAPLGIPAPDRTRDAVEMIEDPAAAARLAVTLEASGVNSAHAIAVLHVSAGNPFRRWPAESFADLAVRLAQGSENRRIVLTSGPSEAGAARAVATAARRRLGARASQVVNAAEFDLQELRALIGQAAVYIGGDSGPLHIAATTATPVVALFGPTLPGRSMPWRDGRWFAEAVDAGPLPCRPCRQRVCEPGDFRCLTRISPEQVAAAAERALSAAPHNALTHGSRTTVNM